MDMKKINRLKSALELLTEVEAGQTFAYRVRKPSELTHAQMARLVRLILTVIESDGISLCASFVKDLPWTNAKAIQPYKDRY